MDVVTAKSRSPSAVASPVTNERDVSGGVPLEEDHEAVNDGTSWLTRFSIRIGAPPNDAPAPRRPFGSCAFSKTVPIDAPVVNVIDPLGATFQVIVVAGIASISAWATSATDGDFAYVRSPTTEVIVWFVVRSPTYGTVQSRVSEVGVCVMTMRSSMEELGVSKLPATVCASTYSTLFPHSVRVNVFDGTVLC